MISEGGFVKAPTLTSNYRLVSPSPLLPLLLLFTSSLEAYLLFLTLSFLPFLSLLLSGGVRLISLLVKELGKKIDWKKISFLWAS